MNRDKFVEGYLERMITKDKDIRKRFESSTEEESIHLRENLRDALSHSYDVYAKEYFDGGIGSYVSTFLRWTGAGADIAGSYLFFAMGGAGFGIKGIGLVEKSLADLIDSRHWAKHAKKLGLTERLSDDAKISAELIAERASAYYLPFAGVADLLRGRSKYDKKVVAKTLQYAKNNFLDYAKRVEAEEEAVEKEPKIIPLDNFRNPDYTEEATEPATIELGQYRAKGKRKAG